MDKVEFFDEESKEYIELYVLEQTRLNGADYLLVTVDEEGDSDALILKDTSAQGEEDAVYTVVEQELSLIHISMAPVIPARLKKGGIFITSGIIDFKEQEVKEALEKAGFEILETNYQGEWVNITAKKC